MNGHASHHDGPVNHRDALARLRRSEGLCSPRQGRQLEKTPIEDSEGLNIFNVKK